MKERDLPAFQATLKRLAVVFRVRTDTEDFRALVTSYFRALADLDVVSLEQRADTWIATQQKFPKPSEWRACLPKRVSTIPDMPDADARAYREAKADRWEREPCHCQSCVEAHVDWKPIRFVPDEERGRFHDPTVPGQTTFTGHWAHGFELQRYYSAKDAFYQHMEELFGPRAFDPVGASGSRRTRGKRKELEPLTPEPVKPPA